MISSDGIRGYNDVIILSVLKDGDSYGYAVSQKIRDVSEENLCHQGDDTVFGVQSFGEKWLYPFLSWRNYPW